MHDQTTFVSKMAVLTICTLKVNTVYTLIGLYVAHLFLCVCVWGGGEGEEGRGGSSVRLTTSMMGWIWSFFVQTLWFWVLY